MAKARPQPLPPQVLAGGAAALVAASRDDPELPRRPRSMSNLPAPREAIPSPTLGIAPPMPEFTDVANLPVAREAATVPNLPATRGGIAGADNLPAPRHAIPAPIDLPAARGMVPPPNLPAARESVPLPALPAARAALPHANLPAPREAVPPANLPAPREAVPVPNLPTPRAAVPPPDLPASRLAVPSPNLPAPREQVPFPTGAAGTHLGLGNLPAARDAVALPNLPAPRGAVPLPNLPAPRSALARLNIERALPVEMLPPGNTPLAPLDFGGGAPAPGLPGLELDFEAPPDAPLGATLFGMSNPPVPPPASGLELDLLDFGLPPGAAAARAPASAPAAPFGPPAHAVDGGLGFRLDIEGADAAAPAPAPAPIVPTSALPAIEVNAIGAMEDAVPELAPHKEDAPAQAAKTRRRQPPRLAIIAGGAALAIAAAAFFVVPKLTGGPAADAVLAPHAAGLERDLAPAYKQAADALLQQAAQGAGGENLRSTAAELLLLARLGRQGPKTFVTLAQQAMEPIAQTAEPTPTERRARALLEIAQGKPQRADALMAGIEDSPGGQLVVGLRELEGGNPAAAVQSFERAVAAEPNRVLPKYLLARSLEHAGQRAKAADAYQQVLAGNPGHVGAALGKLRTGGAKDAALLGELEKLAVAATDASTAAETAAVNVLLGKTAAELGRTALASKAFTQALAADGGNAEASLALAETLLRQGHYNQAFARAQAVAVEAHKTPEGQFVLGGAMIATRRAPEGLAIIEKAAAQLPRDPRGPFFRAWAAEEAPNPNLKAATELYQESLKQAPSFVPASLRLASLMQRTNKATEALKVLKAAEDAGAPPTLLQMAWGQALIVAKQPERAEEVFRKALASDPALAPARLGLAAALEAAGRVGEAKLELDELLVQSPTTEGLRERLAALALRLGEKDEAMAHYEAALASGKAGPDVHVAIGRLAMDTGKLDVASKHLEQVADEAPGTPGALFALGQLREKQGSLGKALSEYRRATSFENTPEVQLAFGRALLAAGKEDDAMLAFREAFTLADAHLEHGRVLLKRSKAEAAIVDFQAAVAIDPDMHEAFLLMGNAYDVLGEAGKAAQAWRNVVKVAPKNVEALYKLGRLEMDRAQVKNALDYLRKAADDVPEDRVWAADVFFQLGYAELQAGSRKNARDALSRYLTLAPTDAPDRPVVEKQLERL